MDLALLKQQIKDYASDLGISKVGFTDAEPLAGHLPRLERRRLAAYSHAITEGDSVKRVTPKMHMADAKSIIAAAVAYPVVRGTEVGADLAGTRGRFSYISRGLDYHIIVRNKLEKLREYILSIVPGASAIVTVDKEEILEKAVAVKAGLGWFGRNTLLVTPEYGSWVCLGEIITDVPFPADLPLASACGQCHACVEACPTKAIDEDCCLNLDRCLAGITQGKFLPGRETRKLMGRTLYGCDICQLACPYNRQDNVTCENSITTSDEAFPLLTELLPLNSREFTARFGHVAGAWRGRTPIQRNAAIVAGNLKAEDAIPVLAEILLKDPRPVLRGAAAWALGEIGTPAAVQALRQGNGQEKDSTVLEEIRVGLEQAAQK